MRNLLQSKKAGSILAIVMILIVVLVVTGGAMLALGSQSRAFAIRDGSQITARCAADAGLTKAICEMNAKLQTGELSDSSLPQVTDEAVPGVYAAFSYQVAVKSSKGGKEYTITSIGNSAYAEKTVSATLRLRGCGEYAVLAQDHIELKANTLVDGFNCANPSDTSVQVQIGTTSVSHDKVVLNNGVVVDGDVFVGVGGNVDAVIKDMGAKTGDRYAMWEEPDFPVITAPLLPAMGKIQVKGQDQIITPAESGKYTSIDLQQKATVSARLVISGGKVVLHITGNIDLGQGCEIVVMPGASLNLYVSGNIKSGEGAGFNNENIPANFKLWGLATDKQEFQLNAKSSCLGQIYAPNANAIVKAKGDLYGAFTAKSFEMKSGGNLFYDGSLRNVNTDDEGVRFVVSRWSE